ncbi:MAG TPA: hypothetical protein VNN80_12965 [Polyangiaceae bacterium]|nr:hypothetical protein [Polyangiaceae bacterium]
MEPLESSQDVPMTKRFAPPRRDAAALGFGTAFIGLGTLALLRAAGLTVSLPWLYAGALIGVGCAGALFVRARA